jgi:hypothetical protein
MRVDKDGFEVDEDGYARINLEVPGEISEERWEAHFTDDFDVLIPPEEAAAINEIESLTRDVNTQFGLSHEHVAAIADSMRNRALGYDGGVAALAERKDLEPSAAIGLLPAFIDRVETSRRVVIPHWDRVGLADLVLRDAPGSKTAAWVAELKWCGPREDILYEGVWDLFKMALAASRPDRPKAYLISGAERAVWGASPFANLFDDATHDPAELCRRRLASKHAPAAWDELLHRGHENYPERIPALLSTSVIGRASVGDWELRAAQVNLLGDDWIEMTGGWPDGDRPEDARHPVGVKD